MSEKYYDQYVEIINNKSNESENDFENTIKYLNAGALVLSLTFVEKIVSFEYIDNVIFLYIAWISFALSLLINLVSSQYSISLMNKTIDEYYTKESNLISQKDENQQKLIQDAFSNSVESRNKRVDYINYASIALFFIGIIFIFYIVISGIENKRNSLKAAKQIEQHHKSNSNSNSDQNRSNNIYLNFNGDNIMNNDKVEKGRSIPKPPRETNTSTTNNCTTNSTQSSTPTKGSK